MANIKSFKNGDRIMHKSWDMLTSDPMTVKRKGKKIFLCLAGEEDTEYDAGGEGDTGWFEVD